MSLYQVDKVLRQVAREEKFRSSFQADPAAFLADRELTSEEREALIRFDYPTLYRMGAHPMLLLHFVRAIRPGDPRTLQPEWDEKIGPLGRPDFST